MMTESQSGLAQEIAGAEMGGVAQTCDLRIAFLTNVIAPYWKPVFAALAPRYRSLRIFLSTPMERNRSWEVDWRGLDVVVQRTVTLNGRWRHPKRFSEPIYIHVSLDTVQQLTRFGANVVISSEMGFRTLMALVYRKWRPASRLILFLEITTVTEQGRGRIRHILRRFIQKRVDGFLVLGESGARYLRSIGVEDGRIFRSPYTTEVARFGAHGVARPEEQARRLLYVGQLIERKGLLPFLRALSKWAANNESHDVEFVLAGAGPLRGQLLSEPVARNVTLTFLGNVSYADLPNVYAQAGIFVFPTFADTWGVVVNEALASGLPVLGSIYSQAVEELVDDGANGWTFQPDDEKRVYEAIDRSMSTPIDKLNQMREHARKTALRLTPEVVAERIDRAVAAVCGSGPE